LINRGGKSCGPLKVYAPIPIRFSRKFLVSYQLKLSNYQVNTIYLSSLKPNMPGTKNIGIMENFAENVVNSMDLLGTSFILSAERNVFLKMTSSQKGVRGYLAAPLASSVPSGYGDDPW
jgi:hypothetical protein